MTNKQSLRDRLLEMFEEMSLMGVCPENTCVHPISETLADAILKAIAEALPKEKRAKNEWPGIIEIGQREWGFNDCLKEVRAVLGVEG